MLVARVDPPIPDHLQKCPAAGSFRVRERLVDPALTGEQFDESLGGLLPDALEAVEVIRQNRIPTQRLGREPSVEELAEALDVPPKKVENMIQVARRPLSLETPTDDEEDSVLGDFIEDDEAPPPDDTATYNLLREHLGEVLNALPPREVRILQLRYGLLDGQAYTLEEVGRKMGVTRERVRQIEAQALSRLRHPSIRRKLRDYLGE